MRSCALGTLVVSWESHQLWLLDSIAVACLCLRRVRQCKDIRHAERMCRRGTTCHRRPGLCSETLTLPASQDSSVAAECRECSMCDVFYRTAVVCSEVRCGGAICRVFLWLG